MRVNVFTLALVLAAAGAARADVVKVGDRLPELDVAVDANGKAFKLKALKGKWLMVTVGAEWCKPCAKELPAWDKLAPEWKDKVVFVAVDLDNKIDDGKAFHDQLKLKNMTRVYMPEEKSAVAGSYGASHMPTTVLADPKGVVRYIRGGFEKGDVPGEVKAMKEQLARLVK
jgi:thiol-disulfide isomerase/thioredoxin